MPTPCPSCGSTRNPSTATICVACGGMLPASVVTPPSPASLTLSGGRRYVLSPTVATIIGSRGCAILLSGAGVEPQHAKLIPLGGGFSIESVMGIVFVNGSQITGATPLDSGADIALGSLTLTYSGPPSSSLPVVSLPPPLATLPKAAPSTSSAAPSVLMTPATLRGGTPAPRWLTKSPPTLRGIVKDVDVKSRTTTHEANTETYHEYRVRVEEPSGAVAQVFLGDLDEAGVSMGDDVGFWGDWRNGMLYSNHCYNYSTNAIVQSGFSLDWLADLKDGILSLIKKIFP